jgi:dTDP-4-dehydrorhamnose 3,5-epimerase
MPFTFHPFPELPEVVLIAPRIFPDERGWFMETYKRSEFARAGIAVDFVQDNQSFSQRAGTVRGLHYQMPPHAQGKLVRCLAGEIFDVVVDIRRGSSTYGRHVHARLAAEEGRMLWVPEGFAHGLMTLCEGTLVSYKVTREYDPKSERSILWSDPALGIAWPREDALLAKKDAEAPLLARADAFP